MSKLTAQGIKTALRGGETSILRDGQGLFLRNRPSGASWFLRVMHKGKAHEPALGKWPDMSLQDARNKAHEIRALIKSGQPYKQEEAEPCPTFAVLAQETWEALKPGWSNGKHVAQWITTIETYANPTLGRKQVDEISGTDVLAVLQPIWHSKSETAKRLKQRLEAVFDRAMAKGFIQISPMHKVKAALGKQHIVRKHFDSLPYSKLAEALDRLDASDASFGLKCLTRFSALTAVRPGEARQAVWGEFDLDKANWHIPAAKKKERRDFTVPLSKATLDILNLMKPFARGPKSYVFPGREYQKPFSENSVRLAFKRNGIPSSAHGLRATLRTWMQDKQINWDLAESILAHSVGSDVSQAYARSDQLELRRKVMEQWAEYLQQPSKKAEPNRNG